MDLPSHKQKLLRAYHHLEEVERLRKSWLDNQRYAVFTTQDPADPDYYLCEVIAPKPEIEGFGVAVGDCLQNLRNGLDHLAYELALAYTQPLPDEFAYASEFPIFGDEDRQGITGVGSALFHRVHSKGSKKGLPVPGSGLAKIQGIHPSAQTVVEGLQPYKRGRDYASDPLWLLHELGRVDKHRLLHPTIGSFAGFRLDIGKCVNVYQIGARPGKDAVLRSYAGVIDGRAVVARIPVLPLDARREVHVEALPVLDIAFDRAAPVAVGSAVTTVLGNIYNYIATKVLPPLNRFL